MITPAELLTMRDEVHIALKHMEASTRLQRCSLTNNGFFEAVFDEVKSASHCPQEVRSMAVGTVLLEWSTGTPLLPRTAIASRDHPAFALIREGAGILAQRLPPEMPLRLSDASIRILPRHLRANEFLIAILLGWRGALKTALREPAFKLWTDCAKLVFRTIPFVVYHSQLQWLLSIDPRLVELKSVVPVDRVIDHSMDRFVEGLCDCSLAARGGKNQLQRQSRCDLEHSLALFDPSLMKIEDGISVLSHLAFLWDFAAQAFSGRDSFFASHVLASIPLEKPSDAAPLAEKDRPQAFSQRRTSEHQNFYERQQRLFRAWTRHAADLGRGILFREINRLHRTLVFQMAAHFCCSACHRWRTYPCERIDCGFDPNQLDLEDPTRANPRIIAQPIYICLNNGLEEVAKTLYFSRRYVHWCSCCRLEQQFFDGQGSLRRVLRRVPDNVAQPDRLASGAIQSKMRSPQPTPTLRPRQQHECLFCHKVPTPSGSPRPVWVPTNCVLFDAVAPYIESNELVQRLAAAFRNRVGASVLRQIQFDFAVLLQNWGDVETAFSTPNELSKRLGKALKLFLADPVKFWWVALPAGFRLAPDLRIPEVSPRWLADWRSQGVPYVTNTLRSLNLGLKTL